MENKDSPDFTRIRLVFFGFIDDVTCRVVDGILDSFDIAYCEYYYDTPRNFSERVPGKSHFYMDVQAGNYKVDWNTVSPLDETLLDRLAHCEATVMRMMDRNDIWAPLSYAQRKMLYLRHVRYWSDCLERNRINLALFSGIPHGSFDYIAYALCKLKGIPTPLFSCPSLLIDTVFLSQNIDDPAPVLEARYRALCQEVPPLSRSQVLLADWIERHYKKMTDFQRDQTPFYMKDPIWEKPFGRDLERISAKVARVAKTPGLLLKKGLNPSYWWDRIAFDKDRRQQDRLFQEIIDFYNNHANEVDLGRKFIYVPLHLQPECTTTPMGGAFVEQQLMVQLLAAAVPDDVLVYVKEHPMQDKYGVVSRSESYYQDLLDIPNVRLVPRDTSTYALMTNCVAVSTATGAAGWEGLFRRKPYLMFGHHVYQYAPGVLRVSDLESCRRAMEMVFREGYLPEINDLRLFLKAIEETAIRGFSLYSRREVTEISDEENVANLTASLLREIREIGFESKVI
jgi:hypothetical protein